MERQRIKAEFPASSKIVVMGERVEPPHWDAIISISFPEGTTRHPSALSRVAGGIGRICAVDLRDEGVRVVTNPIGKNLYEARRDANGVANNLLSTLNMPMSTPVEIYVYPIPEDGTNRGLFLLPDPE